jgi:hypothetical protein
LLPNSKPVPGNSNSVLITEEKLVPTKPEKPPNNK